MENEGKSGRDKFGAMNSRRHDSRIWKGGRGLDCDGSRRGRLVVEIFRMAAARAEAISCTLDVDGKMVVGVSVASAGVIVRGAEARVLWESCLVCCCCCCC